MKSTRIIPRAPSAYDYPLLIKQLLHTPIFYAPEQEIVYRDLKRFTYREFYTRINRLASALTALGVGPGDTVAVLDWDSHRYLECFFAVPMIGAILHTVNVRLSPDQILYTMNHAEDDVVLAHEDFLPLLEEMSGKIETVKTYVLLHDGPERPASSLPLDAEYEEMLAKAEETYEFPDFDENSQATTFYTTGTTGDPKGVYFSHRQLVIHVLAQAAALSSFNGPSLRAGDVYMPITPMFHVHAWGVPYLATLLGLKQIYPGVYDADMLVGLFEKEKVTFSHCVPTLFQMVTNHPRAGEIDFSGWTVLIGGSALSKGMSREAEDLGIKVYAGYGMSETCPLLTLAGPKPHMLDWDDDRLLDINRMAGFPVPLVDLKIIDESGRSLPRDGNSPGEIVVRTPWLTQGYHKSPEKSEELWEGGWLHTGDVATIDQEGFVQITDRLKDVIKTGGEWVSSLEMENFISQHEAVSEAAVVGVEDEKWGERPLAQVVLKPEFSGAVTEDDLKNFLKKFADEGHISKWAIPDRFYLVDEIAKTSVGKINKKAIKAQYA